VWGCITTGKSREEVERNIVEALAGHFAVMRDSGEAIPAPGTWTSEVEVDVPAESSPAPAGSPAETR
jgi:predicted RNase H-like HicB family nuclease